MRYPTVKVDFTPPRSVCFTAVFGIAPESAILMNKSVVFPTHAFEPE